MLLLDRQQKWDEELDDRQNDSDFVCDEFCMMTEI